MSNATNFIKSNLGTIGIGAGGAIVGGILGYAAGSRRAKSPKRRTRRTKNKSTRSRSRIYRKQKKPYTARKHKDTSTRRIRYTKNNQPYVILANGRARFIKKKSVKNSRKRSGGRY